jgi:hypothetical protein
MKMKRMDALFKYWEDPNYVIVEAGQPEAIIDWLRSQTPETWHCVVMTWNYDYEDKVLSWVLQQEDCDKGTAARVFDVEGLGHWIGDKTLAESPNHLCSIVLDNWTRYRSAEFRHAPQDQEVILERVQKAMADGLYVGTPILDVVQYSGSRDAVSEFGSQDGKIVVAFDHWIKSNGIEILD